MVEPSATSADASQPAAPAAPTEAQVADWLRAHPDFLDRHVELLAQLALRDPHGGRAVSLIERQVEVLREKNRALERRVAQLLRTAQDNDAIFDRLQALVRALLLARDDAALPGIVELQLRERFAVPQVALRLWQVAGHVRGLAHAPPVEAVVIEQTAALGVPYCGPVSEFRAAALLSDNGADTRSIALVPLRVGAQPRPFGLLALGSADAERFTPELGTAFLQRIGEVVSAALARLAAPADEAP